MDSHNMQDNIEATTLSATASPAPSELGGAPRDPTHRGWLRDLLETILPAVAVVLAINLFLAQPRVVHGQSMEPNLHESQRVIVDLISYRVRPPQYGEIVVLDVPERKAGPPLIKRIIGLPGDTVEIQQGAVFVNGHKLEEPYLDQVTTGALPATIVPEEHVFVLGDNRQYSNDSRYFGTVPFESILGRAWLSYWPLTDIHLFN
jgi:signal peptidase I